VGAGALTGPDEGVPPTWCVVRSASISF